MSVFFYSISSASLAAIVKYLSFSAPLLQILFIIYVTAFVLMLFCYFSQAQRRQDLYKTNKTGMQILKSILGILQMFAVFLAYKHIPLSNALVLRGTAPIMLPVFAFVFLPTDKFKSNWVAILLGIIGVIVLVHPGLNDTLRVYSLFALLSAAFLALNILFTRKLNEAGEPKYRTLFYTLFLPTSFLAAWELYAWHSMSVGALLLALFAGLLLFITINFFIFSFKWATPKFVTPFTYSIFIFAGIYDWIFWGDKPSILVLVGTALIVLACYLNHVSCCISNDRVVK